MYEKIRFFKQITLIYNFNNNMILQKVFRNIILASIFVGAFLITIKTIKNYKEIKRFKMVWKCALIFLR